MLSMFSAATGEEIAAVKLTVAIFSPVAAENILSILFLELCAFET